MGFHPLNQCWRWDKASDLTMWLDDKWSVVDDWIIQRSERYYAMRQRQEHRARMRILKRTR